VIHLVCLGSPLHADDGFGAVMAARLTSLDWPAHVRLLDGTACSPLPLFDNCRHAILLAALPPESGSPGQVLRLDASALPSVDPMGTSLANLVAAVRRVLPKPPSMEVMGPVAALRKPFSPGLSPLVMAAVGTATAMLTADLGGSPHRGRRRGAA
jgi:hydrogenase maturation protease